MQGLVDSVTKRSRFRCPPNSLMQAGRPAPPVLPATPHCLPLHAMNAVLSCLQHGHPQAVPCHGTRQSARRLGAYLHACPAASLLTLYPALALLPCHVTSAATWSMPAWLYRLHPRPPRPPLAALAALEVAR